MSTPFARTTVGSGEGSRPKAAWRGTFDADGNPVYEPIDWDSGKYVAPSTGQYTLMVVGYTEPQLDTKFPNQQGEYVDKFAVELEIAEGRGKGFRFFWSYQTPKISFGDGGNFSPSNIGMIWKAACNGGKAPEKGIEVGFDDVFGKPWNAYVVASDERNDKGFPKYARVTAKTITPIAGGESGAPDPFDAAMQQAQAS